MPKYVYFCVACKELSTVTHSLGKTCEICPICGSTEGLERRPSSVFVNKKMSQFKNKNKAGEVVKTTIEDMKQDLREEKTRLKERTIDDI